MAFEVKIEVFEGPFDLLLQLIMRQELDIHRVPVAQIARSYIEHIEKAAELDLDVATEFLIIAATLLLIKARSLLPDPEEETEFAEESETARELLVERLIGYRKFQSVAGWLEDRLEEHGSYVPSLRELQTDYSHLYPDPFEGKSAADLTAALVDLLLENAAEGVDDSHIAPIRVSVREQLERLEKLIQAEGDTTFSRLVGGCGSKLEVIATFLAVLELYKRGELELRQRKPFGEIEVLKKEGEKSGVA